MTNISYSFDSYKAACDKAYKEYHDTLMATCQLFKKGYITAAQDSAYTAWAEAEYRAKIKEYDILLDAWLKSLEGDRF